MPKVSVIIPVYNTEKYLQKCLDSVCNQTLSAIEIICINDASTDNSLAILEEYAKKDNRIKLIDFKENKGAAVARNTGIDEAQGEYIGFVDSDDFVDLDFYEKLYNKAKESDADVAKGNIYDCDEKGQNPVLTNFYNMNDKISKNKAYFYYGFTSAIYKNLFVKGHKINFPANISFFEDPCFSINIFINSPNLVIENRAIYYYRRRFDSLCKSFNFNNLKNSINIIVSMLNESKISEKSYSVIFSFLYNFVQEKIVNPKISEDIKFEILNFLLGLIDACKYKRLGNQLVVKTLKPVPIQYKIKFLIKRNQLLNVRE